ncbi:MAG: amino acid ABC transporter substrate-binding protein [Acidobacteriia bacterium]|nr:amino acid ABC transporter substrate-binding protein [Terriglobia bacterium]
MNTRLVRSLCLAVASCILVPATFVSTAWSQTEIKIGVIMPITGREAKPGQFQKEGLELAFKQINDQGGVFVKSLKKKLPIKEVFYDDGSDQAKSTSLVERAISSDGVTAVLGGYSTVLGEAESVMPDRYKTPWITPGAAASSIFAKGYKYTFGTLSPVDSLGVTTGEYLGSLMDSGKLKKGLKVALAVENTDHGVDYVKGIQEWASKHPGYYTVVFNERFDLGSPDFTALLQKVKNAHADMFLSDAHLQDYITMQRQYLQGGMYHQMVSYGARGPESDARKALGDGTNYIFAGVWWSSDLPYPQAKKFIQDYKQATGRNPDSWYAATAYDAARILVAAIEKAGSLNKDAIRYQLKTVQLKDSILPGQLLKFGANGQANLPFVIVQTKPGGKTDIVYPKDAATGESVAPMPKR